MAGGKRLSVAEITIKGLRGQALSDALASELNSDQATNKGSEGTSFAENIDNIGK